MTNSNNKALKQIDSLYPLKFNPILKSIIWGGSAITDFKNIKPSRDGIGESWEISGVEDNISIISNGKHSGISLEELLSEKKELLSSSHKIY
jgi:mannose-6-phosphate isomerase